MIVAAVNQDTPAAQRAPLTVCRCGRAVQPSSRAGRCEVCTERRFDLMLDHARGDAE